MKVPRGLLNTKAPPWAQEPPSPQKVGEHLGEFHELPLFFPGEKNYFLGKATARWNTVLPQNSVIFLYNKV